MVVKVAGGVLGIGLIGAGGIAVAKPHWLGMDYMPTFHALSKDSDFSTTVYDSGKLGNKFKNYLVGVTNKKDNTNKNNQSWWEWSFRQLKKDSTVKGKFSTVDRDYETSGSVALNQVCKEAYKKQDSDLKGDSSSETIEASDFKKSDFWKYCSPLGEKPKTVSDRKENTNKYQTQSTIGNDSSNAEKLVSTEGNDLFWTIRNKEFKNEDNYGPIESGDSADNFFNTSRGKSIRDLCELAYQQKESAEANGATDKPNKNKALKYCSLDKQ